MKRKYILPGLLMILIGLYFLIASLPGIVMPSGLFFIAIGAALLIARLFNHRRYGLTIAGFILFWLGAGQLMLDVLHIGGQYALVAAPLAIALAFFLTHIFEYRRLGNWPMIPALILLAFAVVFFLMLTPSVNSVLKPYYGTILPLILICIGIAILVRGGRRNRSAAPEQPISVEFNHVKEDIPAPDQWAQPPVQPVAPAAESAVPAYEPADVEPEIIPAEPEPVTAEPETIAPEIVVLPETEPEEEHKTDVQTE